jgi:lipopolysaccharide assembly outer membrane protein LptD (OstA)
VKLTEDGCVDTSACVIISTVGINASAKSNLFTVYPNPTSGQLTIEFENEFSNVQLTVRNVLGQTVFTKNYTTGNQINFTLEDAAGIYFIEVVDQDNLTQLKVIKE